ncbi:hypothetical protein GUJ93_ZPchr0012g21438 [Zizania palustris]|uniref:Uncharacterized protein n=1 Tax=Zizania palustris TaxID=103762 RepID=A0A8J5WNB1_ZIZPA|nr:hypothetical protein GUJ93_ZPchr0012g21438 [Zizania palustris]
MAAVGHCLPMIAVGHSLPMERHPTDGKTSRACSEEARSGNKRRSRVEVSRLQIRSERRSRRWIQAGGRRCLGRPMHGRRPRRTSLEMEQYKAVRIAKSSCVQEETSVGGESVLMWLRRQNLPRKATKKVLHFV